MPQITLNHRFCSPPILLSHRFQLPNLVQDAAIAKAKTEALAKLEQRTPIQDTNITEEIFNFFQEGCQHQAAQKKCQEDLEKDEQLETLMLQLLQSGNIDLAMLLFAQLESQQSQGLTAALTSQLQAAQQKRRDLTAQMGQVQQGQQNSQAQLSNVQLGLQEVSDTLQMLTTMIKDINDQKNRTVEFANNFLNSEHQTTLSLVRGMRG